jgi:hypothetical protein
MAALRERGHQRITGSTLLPPDTLWRDDSSRTLGDLPARLTGQTLEHFRQDGDVGQVSGVLLGEQRRFGELLVRGRAEDELRYLHETHGLPRELVVGLLSEPA